MIELAEGIFYFEKLLPETLCDSIIRDITKPEISWKTGGRLSGSRSIYNYRAEDEISRIKEFESIGLGALHEVLSIYQAFDTDKKIPVIDESFAFLYRFTRYTEGSEFRPHFDSILGKQSVTVVSYLNSYPDYIGGEINYPKQRTSVSPKKGSILIHPSSFAYPHSVNKVTKGVKYICLTAFDLFSKNSEVS